VKIGHKNGEFLFSIPEVTVATLKPVPSKFYFSLDCSQPSIFSYCSSIVEPGNRVARELDTSAKGRLDWVGGEDRDEKRGCRHLWKKVN